MNSKYDNQMVSILYDKFIQTPLPDDHPKLMALKEKFEMYHAANEEQQRTFYSDAELRLDPDVKAKSSSITEINLIFSSNLQLDSKISTFEHFRMGRLVLMGRIFPMTITVGFFIF